MQSTRFGWTLLAVSALTALAACTNTTTTAANDPSPGVARVANSSTSSHPVTDVADALGQRLNTMVNQKQTR